MLAASGTDVEVVIAPPRPPPRVTNNIPPVPKPRKVIAKIKSEVFSDTKLSEQIKTEELKNHDSEIQDESTRTSLNSDIRTPDIELMKSESHITPALKTLSDDNVLNHDGTTDNKSEYKPPEIVGVILKKSASEDSMHGKTEYDNSNSDPKVLNFKIGINTEDEAFEAKNKYASGFNIIYNSSLDPSLAHSDKDEDDDLAVNDLNIQMFSHVLSKNDSKRFKGPLRHLHSEIHFDSVISADDMPENMSVTSLKSVDSLPSFMDSSNMKKWSNYEDLDEISIISANNVSLKNKWVVGDTTDTGMFYQFY